MAGLPQASRQQQELNCGKAGHTRLFLPSFFSIHITTTDVIFAIASSHLVAVSVVAADALGWRRVCGGRGGQQQALDSGEAGHRLAAHREHHVAVAQRLCRVLARGTAPHAQHLPRPTHSKIRTPGASMLTQMPSQLDLTSADDLVVGAHHEL